MARHKVFVSYHHINPDQVYRDQFELLANQNDIFISKSVQIGDIRPDLTTDYIRQVIRDQYLRDSTVTVVLIGPTTWQRKHVDWEISSSIRNTVLNPRSGLLGILLPHHPNYKQPGYTAGIVPPRLVKNQECGYAKIFDWTTDPSSIGRWIDDAFSRKSTQVPDNSYPHFVNNKSSSSWL